MCAVSMVYKHYEQQFPPRPLGPPRSIPWQPMPIGAAEVAEIRQLIAEFHEALAAAKRVDELTKQPDCFDPKKATLEERVAELERRLAEAP